ncbi:MAG TPA: BON domain-containing protein [Nitrospira sp.]|nr:BON domain-containing protein [Nitrospira sp.]
MNNAKLLARILISFTLLFGVASCASSPTQESTGQYVDDAAITAKVKAKIVGEQSLKGFDIKVETFKGTVQLSGFVDSADLSAKAEKLARGVNGVKSVKNSLVVK